MKRSRFNDEQIIAILKQQESGVATADVCREHGISSATFYKWKAKFGGLDVSDARKLKALADENAKLKKRIVRTVIQEVVADLDDDASEIVLLVHWAGGAHTEIRLPKRRRGQRNATPLNIVEAVRQLARIASDDVIAGVLNRNGLATGNGNRWTRERITALRSYRKIPVFKSDPGGLDPWLNLSSAAKLLGLAPKNVAVGSGSR